MKCFYATSGINYKNGTVTVCPRQSDQLAVMDVPSKIFNSDGFKWVRQNLEWDMWPTGCDLCHASESIGHPSMRHDHPYVADHSNGWSHYDNLRHVELRFSNACNMSCLHCSEVYSSGWTKRLEGYEPSYEVKGHELIQLTKEMHRNGAEDQFKMQMSMDMMEAIVLDLNKNFPQLEMIDFAGGEVTIQKQFYPCLELLAKHPNAKNITISFHTNFNTDFIPRDLHRRLMPFKKGVITVSLDAGKNIYGYFRQGDWDKMKWNINEMKELGGRIDIQPTCTTSIYQMMDFYNIWESFLELNVDGYDASIVQSPLYLDPSLIMYDFGDEIQEEIDRTKELVVGTDAEWWVYYIEDYIKKAEVPYRHYNSFLLYIQETDKIWNQRFNDFFTKVKMKEGELYWR